MNIYGCPLNHGKYVLYFYNASQMKDTIWIYRFYTFLHEIVSE